MRLLISFTALFLSIFLLQVSTGGVGPLDVLSGSQLGFSNSQIGLLGSAHFLGFFIGCWWAPRLMGTVGHSRAFAAFAATGAIGLLAHTLTDNPTAWAIMRVASGLAVAGCYTVAEAWLQAKVTNKTRGRAMGSYRMVDLTGSLVAQLLIGVLEPASYASYNMLALLAIATLLPLMLTNSSEPVTPTAPRLRPGLAWVKSPLAVAGVMVAAVSSASFRMVGPLYGAEVGLRPEQIAFFLAAFVLGGALAQLPAGWLADRYDRRWVLIFISLVTLPISFMTIAVSGMGTTPVMLAAFTFGLVTMPIYSISAAHAHDWAEDHERVELSAALMFFYALGAIAAPLLTSNLITAFGPGALFVFISLAHLALVGFGLIRMRRRPSATTRTRYVWIPRTSFSVGRLFRRNSDKT